MCVVVDDRADVWDEASRAALLQVRPQHRAARAEPRASRAPAPPHGCLLWLLAPACDRVAGSCRHARKCSTSAVPHVQRTPCHCLHNLVLLLCLNFSSCVAAASSGDAVPPAQGGSCTGHGPGSSTAGRLPGTRRCLCSCMHLQLQRLVSPSLLLPLTLLPPCLCCLLLRPRLRPLRAHPPTNHVPRRRATARASCSASSTRSRSCAASFTRSSTWCGQHGPRARQPAAPALVLPACLLSWPACMPSCKACRMPRHAVLLTALSSACAAATTASTPPGHQARGAAARQHGAHGNPAGDAS